MDFTGNDVDMTNRINWAAVIGSRQATDKELETAYSLGAELVEQGYTVVNGLAIGIDASALVGAVDRLQRATKGDGYKYGNVVAVVNTPKGFDIYPKANTRLADRVTKYGCILHPYATPAVDGPGFNQFQRRLIERDLIVAKLCSVIIVVSDNEIIEGGSRYAAYYGQRYGKEVYRLSSGRVYHPNVKTAYCRVGWPMEFDLDTIV